MKYRIKFMESKTPRIVNVKDSKELSIYMNEKLNKIESIEPICEEVKSIKNKKDIKNAKKEHARKILDIALAKLPDTKPNTQEYNRLNKLITDCYNEIGETELDEVEKTDARKQGKMRESVSDLPDGGDDDRIFQEFCKTLNELANYWEDLALEKRNKAFNECAESLRGVVALYKEKWDNR